MRWVVNDLDRGNNGLSVKLWRPAQNRQRAQAGRQVALRKCGTALGKNLKCCGAANIAKSPFPAQYKSGFLTFLFLLKILVFSIVESVRSYHFYLAWCWRYAKRRWLAGLSSGVVAPHLAPMPRPRQPVAQAQHVPGNGIPVGAVLCRLALHVGHHVCASISYIQACALAPKSFSSQVVSHCICGVHVRDHGDTTARSRLATVGVLMPLMAITAENHVEMRQPIASAQIMHLRR